MSNDSLPIYCAHWIHCNDNVLSTA